MRDKKNDSMWKHLNIPLVDLHLLVFPVEMAANRLSSSSSNFIGPVAARSLNPGDLVGVSTGRDSAILK